MSRQTIAKWLEEAAATVDSDELSPSEFDQELLLEMDEVWSFIVGKRKNKLGSVLL